MPFFDIFASPRWSPLRMRTKVVSFFIFFKSFQTKKKLKGSVTIFSDFLRFFLREQKMAVARASVTDIDLKAWPSARPGSLATYSGRVTVRHVRWLLTWQCREPTTSRAIVALFHLSTATGSTFVFRLRGPSKVISPSSRFKISSDSYIGIDSLFGCLVLRAFWSLLRRSISSPRAWVTGRRNGQCGRMIAAPFPVTLTMCVTVKANALNEERVRGTDVDVRANTGFVVAFAQYVTKTWRLKKRTCGKLWGRPAGRQRTFEGDAQGPCMSSVQLLSARRRTFEHWTSCCPSRDATMVVLTKKKKKKKKKNVKRRFTTPRKRSFEGRCQRWKRDVLSSPQFGGG